MDWTLLGFILYLIVILYVGFRTYRINKSYKDYFIAGRKLNPWVVAFSERASSESSWLILGLPGAAFALGFVEIWSALGCTLGVIASWTFVAKPLRIETEKYDAITLPDYYAEKFGNDTTIRLIAAIIIVFFFLFYLAAQFNGAGKVFNVTFGIPHVWGMILGAVIIVFYTMLGGFFAVAWTDLIQGIIMIGALVILPLVGLIELAQHGTNLADAVSSSGSNFTSLTGGKIGWAAVAAVIAGLSWGLGYMGQPHLVTRFMSIRSADEIKISRRIAIVWAIPAFAGAILIGLCFLALKN
ncbi:MAG: sodium/proline symporter, partial [Candidatus Stygibacter australis]|nr:sodium/proline symporter [Candidatus Stygibacter australis]